MTEQTLVKVKLAASRLTSSELWKLSRWASDLASKRSVEEDRKRRLRFSESLKIGDRVALSSFSDPRFDVVSGEAAVVTKVGRSRIYLRYTPEPGEDGSPRLVKWGSAEYPYLDFWLRKGHPALKPIEELDTAKRDADLTKRFRPVLTKMTEALSH